jgi:hypothetical protein
MVRRKDEDTSGGTEGDRGAHPSLWGRVVLPLGVGIWRGGSGQRPVREEDVSGHEGVG